MLLAGLALLPSTLSLPGCVSRKLYLKSEPPGATVYLDGQRAGVTPYEGELPAYGTRSLELDLAGYHRLTQDLALPWPWWQYVPLDMVTDLLIPWTIEDHREFSFQLVPVSHGEGTWEDAEAAHRRLEELKASVQGEAEAADGEGADGSAPAPEGGGA